MSAKFSICFFSILFSISILSVAQQKLTLQQSVQLAKANNPFLKTSFFDIGIAQTDIISAQLRPNLKLNNQTLQMTNPNTYFKKGETLNNQNRQVWWQVTKTFQLPYQRKYKIDFAETNVLLEQKNFAELQRNLALDVADQWLAVWSLKTKLDLFIQAKNNVDSLVKINELRYKNLVITQTDVIRTKLIAEQYHLQIRSITQQYTNELRKLRLTIGSTDSITIDPDDQQQLTLLGTQNIDSLLAYGLKNRTDAQAAATAIKASDANIRLQRSFAYPQPELGMIWNPQNAVPYMGFFGTVEIPLWSRNQGLREKSKVQKQQAEQALEATQLQIVTDIQTSYRSFLTEQQNVSHYENILTQSETVLNSVRYSYLRGGTTIVDFLEAQRSWFDTRQLYFDAVLSYRTSYMQLLYSTGLINQLYE
jgi:outer membrane protein, heavy metal efflux system